LKLNELGEKGKFQVVAEAVGMWEARGFCELSIISIAIHSSLSGIACRTSL
jgi:hypothetical protein